MGARKSEGKKGGLWRGEGNAGMRSPSPLRKVESNHLNCRLILNYSALSVTYYHEELDGKMDDAKT